VTTPAWSAAQNGLPGSLDATNASAQINQFLGTHGITAVYDGTQVLTPGGTNNFTWVTYGDGTDLDQSFVLSGTAVSRVTIPIKPMGNGADMLVSLYADSGGSPNLAAGAIAATMVPAAISSQLAAPDGLISGGPLATAKYNSGYLTGGVTTNPYPVPTAGAGGVSVLSSFAVDGDFIISVGGGQPPSAIASPDVNTFQYVGGGTLAPPVPQPSLPVGNNGPGIAVASDTLVVMGGGIGATGSTPVSTVWTAGWDGNTGIVGSWSAQTALPGTSQFGGAAGYNGFVYYVGGTNGSINLATVYYSPVVNGQINAWTSGPPLPVALSNPIVAAVNGWLFVIGGLNSSFAVVSTVYYAVINADGSLGPWQTGPVLPAAVQAFGPGFDTAVADDMIVIIGGAGSGGLSISNCMVLSVTADGPSDTWVNSAWNGTRFFPVFAFGTGAGSYDIVAVDLNALPPQTESSTLLSVPLLSVPLNATGLTNGSTYHVVLQQNQQATAGDYLAWGLLNGPALPNAAMNSTRHSGTWSTITGYSVPMSVYNNVSTNPNVRHLVDDISAYNVNQRWSTMEYNSATSLLIGHLDAILMPNNPLNSNPTVATATAPWTATNGVLTRTNAQTHGGFAFSGLLTPTGGFTTAFISSEKVPVSQGGGPFYGTSQWYLADGWFYSTPGWPNFNLSVNWYDRNGGFLSTTVGANTNLSAATWTHVQTYAEAPATAAFGQLVPTETGSPAATRLLYCSDAFLVLSPECVGSFTSAAVVDYPTSGAPWPPTGVTQLL
jgi:hypothetical protein